MAKAKGKRRSFTTKKNNGRNLGPTVKKWGIFKGPGKFAATQTGIKSLQKIVPAYLMLVAVSAATPSLGRQIGASASTVPIVAPIVGSAVGYGSMLRARLGR